MSNIAAVFDFDGTLTKRDTLLPFLRFASGRNRFWRHLPGLIPVLAAYEAGMVSNTTLKEKAVSRLLFGIDEQELKESAEKFALRCLDSYVRPEAIRRLRWHQRQRHRTALVSASFEIYLRPWAERMRFDAVAGTFMSYDSTGLHIDNCHGPRKLERLQELWPDLDDLELYAYGDSSGDSDLLSRANYKWFKAFPFEDC